MKKKTKFRKLIILIKAYGNCFEVKVSRGDKLKNLDNDSLVIKSKKEFGYSTIIDFPLRNNTQDKPQYTFVCHATKVYIYT